MNYTPFVYLLKFLPTGQLYIGSKTSKGSSVNNLWSTYFSSSKVIKALIKEHGKDAFRSEVRKVFETREEALEYEYRLLKRVDAKMNPKFLNMSYGGKNFSGSTRTKEHQENLTKSLVGKKRSAETRENMKRLLTIKGPRKSKPMSQETKDKISLANKGKGLGRKRSTEANAKIVEAQRNRVRAPYSEESRKKMSDSAKMRPAISQETRDRMSASMKGRVFSEEHKQKIRFAKRSRHHAEADDVLLTKCMSSNLKLTLA